MQQPILTLNKLTYTNSSIQKKRGNFPRVVSSAGFPCLKRLRASALSEDGGCKQKNLGVVSGATKNHLVAIQQQRKPQMTWRINKKY